MTTNLYVWAKIKKLNLDFVMKLELFQIIDKYLHRVKFVTETVEGKDNLFMAENRTNYENKTFLELQKDNEVSDDCKETNFIRILMKLNNFFEGTERVLYITVGFEEGEEDGSSFPKWYAGELFEQSGKVISIDYVFDNVISVIETRKTNGYINELLSKKELTNEEKQMLKKLSEQRKIKTPV